MFYFLNIVLAIIPEILYFTLFIILAKQIKEKRILLFILIAISYFLFICIKQYVLLYYIGFIISIYLILKLLYKDKAQLIDIFVISLSSIYLTLLSYVCFKFLKEDLSNYMMLFLIDRILMYIPFIYGNKFNLLYKKIL